jgi:hypothetical protein
MRPNHVGGFWLPSLAAAHTFVRGGTGSRTGSGRSFARIYLRVWIRGESGWRSLSTMA